MTTTSELEIETPGGTARATLHEAVGVSRPAALVALGHGAGGGIGARDLVVMARQLPAAGVAVALVEQPWRVAGKKVAGRPPTLDAAWIPAMAALRAAVGDDVPLVTGGRSAGARVACRTAPATGASAVICLAFPLHPPGKPESSRADELLGAGVPTLVVQGSRDPFGGPGEFPDGPRMFVIEGGDHGLKVPARSSPTQTEWLVRAADEVLAFISALG